MARAVIAMQAVAVVIVAEATTVTAVVEIGGVGREGGRVGVTSGDGCRDRIAATDIVGVDKRLPLPKNPCLVPTLASKSARTASYRDGTRDGGHAARPEARLVTLLEFDGIAVVLTTLNGRSISSKCKERDRGR